VGQATYVALLRGINLGARNKVSMPDLRELFAGLGAEDVTTYLQSGNVVFKAPAARAKPGAIEQRISRELGLDVNVLVRTPAQLARIVERNPFVGQASEPKKQLHVTFLADSPPAARVKELDPERSPPDEFRVTGREVYLHCPKGYGPSKLSNAYFEQKLGVVATTRNWNTVTQLAELAANTKR
jgi:uncharacterized protein (DUF1697 family)